MHGGNDCFSADEPDLFLVLVNTSAGSVKLSCGRNRCLTAGVAAQSFSFLEIKH